MRVDLALGYENDRLFSHAKKLAEQLNLPLDNQAKHQLVLTDDKLVLKFDTFSPLYADFNSATWQRRRDAGKKQGLVKACKPRQGMRIIDATAGWGRDAAILASFGAEVLMFEREPILAALLSDALERQDEHSKKSLNITLYPMDVKQYLETLTPSDYPDVIYIDPMHPQRQKTALVKKELQVLQHLIGPDDQVLSLLELSMKRALKQVVMKWPQHLPALRSPTNVLRGKTVRFDLYRPILTSMFSSQNSVKLLP